MVEASKLVSMLATSRALVATAQHRLSRHSFTSERLRQQQSYSLSMAPSLLQHLHRTHPIDFVVATSSNPSYRVCRSIFIEPIPPSLSYQLRRANSTGPHCSHPHRTHASSLIAGMLQRIALVVPPPYAYRPRDHHRTMSIVSHSSLLT